MPTPIQLESAYEEDYTAAGHYSNDPGQAYNVARPLYRAMLRELEDSQIPKGVVLDFGCGWGGFLSLLEMKGYDAVGTDLESDRLKFCRENGLKVVAGDIDELTRRADTYSAIFLNNVIEHLPDPYVALIDLGKILRKGGAIFVLIPTSNVYFLLAKLVQCLCRTDAVPKLNTTFCPPWHTNILSVMGVRKLANRAGFSVDRIAPAGCGNNGGFFGVAQKIFGMVSFAGYHAFREAFPIIPNHIFILRREFRKKI